MRKLMFALIAWLMAAHSASGQVISQAPDLASIDAIIERVTSDDTLSAETSADALGLLTEARVILERAKEREAQTTEYSNFVANAETIISDLNVQISNAVGTESPSLDGMSADDLRSRLALLSAERLTLSEALTQMQSEQTGLSNRAALIADEIAAARQTLSDFPDISLGDASDAEPVIEEARLALVRVRKMERESAIADLQSELASLPARQIVGEARLELAEMMQTNLSAELAAVRDRLNETSQGRADTHLAEAQLTLERAGSLSPKLQEWAEENVALAQTLSKGAGRTPALSQRTTELEHAITALSHSTDTVEQVLATGSLTDDLGAMLRRVRSTLPEPQTLRSELANNEDARIALQLNIVLWQDGLRAASDPSAAQALTQTSAEGDIPASPVLLTEAANLVSARKTHLTELIMAARSETDLLTNQEISLKRLLDRTTKLSGSLDRRLLWLRTGERANVDWLTALPTSLAWILSPSSWLHASHRLIEEVMKRPLPVSLVIFLLSIILWARPAILRRLSSLSDRVGNVGRDTYWTTPNAFGLSFLLTLPAPLAIGSVGWLLGKAGPEAGVFAQALSRALIMTALTLFILILFRVMSRPEGVFHRHFRWTDLAAANFRRHLKWYTWLLPAMIFLITMALSSNDQNVHTSVGVLSFAIASLGIAAFSYQFFKPKGGIVSEIRADKRPSAMLALAFPILVGLPLLNGALPLFGYFDTAIQIQARLFDSGALLLLAATIYGLIMRVFMVSNRRFALRKAIERRAKTEAARAEAADAEASGEASPPDLEEQAADAAIISEQMRTIFLMLAGAAYLIGLLMIWSPLIPALGIAQDVVLWQNISVSGGVEITERITLWNLILASLILVGGAVAAKNIGGVLQVGLFEQLDIDAGARYAAITVTGYILVGIGIIAGFSQLGMDWSKLQWIIAALGVGLGFGLQEIVANFVSGLIILFERPIRVGDTITIGQLSGTVSSIKIRATAITDFDNRVVLLPNKTIITDNVTNWTLNDAVTRLILKVGVAYGSDIQQVRDLLMQVAKAHPDVLETPPPTVFFMQHGDSSLNFELRVFVGSPNRRLPVTHELNTDINLVLSENNIEIPFPQSDIHMKLAGEGSQRATSQ